MTCATIGIFVIVVASEAHSTTVSTTFRPFTSKAFTRTSITLETTGFIVLQLTTSSLLCKAMLPDRFRFRQCADGQCRTSEDFNLEDTMSFGDPFLPGTSIRP